MANGMAGREPDEGEADAAQAFEELRAEVAALRQGIEERDRPTVIDIVVTRDPAQMLPAVDNRTVAIRQGDRVA